MIGNEQDSVTTSPLNGIKLVTVVKVIDCNVFHNGGERPWNQISIGGFALDGMWNVVFMDMMFSADDGDDEEVNRLLNIYSPGSLHWVDSTFSLLGGGFSFLYPETRPVSVENFEAINAFFPVEVKASRVPRKGEFWYAGRYYVTGGGAPPLGKRPYFNPNPNYGSFVVEGFIEDNICQFCGNSSVEPFARCYVSEQPICSDCASGIREFCRHYNAVATPPDAMLRLVEITGYPLDECCAIWLYQELDALVSDFRDYYEYMDCAAKSWGRSTIAGLQYRLNDIVGISKKLLHPSLSRTPQAAQHMKD
ncbi:hypothetical protein [Geomobilimonas luticola]|uniref:Uncharacterized protein n=1 Tax=Geomobilimonas luticola TaxID=1114878 RepID=A0ABS5SAE0_9BACT|nr:hypothetical protein [Geomobilimonas luticola]MBT0652343.1 hypothetical protein [Geomobilimonas luticola]